VPVALIVYTRREGEKGTPCYALGVKGRVEELLRLGEYDEAYEVLLAQAERRFAPRAATARALVDLAEFYSLYGESEAEPWAAALAEARARWPEAAGLPLFRALEFELAALRGEEATPPEVSDPRSRYHLAQGLAYAGRSLEALAALPEGEGLPAFLRSRTHTLRARLLESLGSLDEAAREHRLAARLARGKEALWSRLDAAALWLDAGAPQEARRDLEAAEPLLPQAEMADRATFHYLLARVELASGNPELAASQIAQAEGLEAAGAGLSHGTAMVRAQVHQQLGQPELARGAYREATKRARESDLPYIWHEWGVSELDAGELLEAEGLLLRVVDSDSYPYRAQALADLAEVYYRLGDGPRAEASARRSLALKPTAAAHLILGNRAYDVGHWDEALAHYRAAVALAREGDHDWVTAAEMTVDVLAQMGYPNPAEVAELAERVLPYLSAGDEWGETMRNYAARARRLAREGRLLN